MDIISKTFRMIENRYGDLKNNLSKFPPEVKTFIIVHAVQGVIDNGGYRYLFSSNWPGKPQYSDFIDAYKAIGCESQALELERIVATFPFENPHLYEEKRLNYMKRNQDPSDENTIVGWGDALCGDTIVLEKLKEYCTKHMKGLA